MIKRTRVSFFLYQPYTLTIFFVFVKEEKYKKKNMSDKQPCYIALCGYLRELGYVEGKVFVVSDFAWSTIIPKIEKSFLENSEKHDPIYLIWDSSIVIKEETLPFLVQHFPSHVKIRYQVGSPVIQNLEPERLHEQHGTLDLLRELTHGTLDLLRELTHGTLDVRIMIYRNSDWSVSEGVLDWFSTPKNKNSIKAFHLLTGSNVSKCPFGIETTIIQTLLNQNPREMSFVCCPIDLCLYKRIRDVIETYLHSCLTAYLRVYLPQREKEGSVCLDDILLEGKLRMELLESFMKSTVFSTLSMEFSNVCMSKDLRNPLENEKPSLASILSLIGDRFVNVIFPLFDENMNYSWLSTCARVVCPAVHRDICNSLFKETVQQNLIRWIETKSLEGLCLHSIHSNGPMGAILDPMIFPYQTRWTTCLREIEFAHHCSFPDIVQTSPLLSRSKNLQRMTLDCVHYHANWDTFSLCTSLFGPYFPFQQLQVLKITYFKRNRYVPIIEEFRASLVRLGQAKKMIVEGRLPIEHLFHPIMRAALTDMPSLDFTQATFEFDTAIVILPRHKPPYSLLRSTDSILETLQMVRNMYWFLLPIMKRVFRLRGDTKQFGIRIAEMIYGTQPKRIYDGKTFQL
jgi:hypothetical protein